MRPFDLSSAVQAETYPLDKSQVADGAAGAEGAGGGGAGGVDGQEHPPGSHLLTPSSNSHTGGKGVQPVGHWVPPVGGAAGVLGWGAAF